jgi:hypothetical protein
MGKIRAFLQRHLTWYFQNCFGYCPPDPLTDFVLDPLQIFRPPDQKKLLHFCGGLKLPSQTICKVVIYEKLKHFCKDISHGINCFIESQWPLNCFIESQLHDVCKVVTCQQIRSFDKDILHCIFKIASASGGLRPPDPLPGFALDPLKNFRPK